MDPINELEPMGRGVLFDSYNVVGGCVVLSEIGKKNERHIYPTGHRVDSEQRSMANGHRSGVRLPPEALVCRLLRRLLRRCHVPVDYPAIELLDALEPGCEIHGLGWSSELNIR